MNSGVVTYPVCRAVEMGVKCYQLIIRRQHDFRRDKESAPFHRLKVWWVVGRGKDRSSLREI